MTEPAPEQSTPPPSAAGSRTGAAAATPPVAAAFVLPDREHAVPPAPCPGRRFSPILFRYLAVELLIPLFCCLGGFATLFVMSTVFDDLQDLLTVGAGFGVTLRYFILRQPANLVHVLPMSMLLATSFMIHNLGRHHEVTALRAAGLSLFRSCLPVWAVALLCTAATLWIGERVGPMWDRQAGQLKEQLTGDDRPELNRRAKLAYRNSRDRRDWFFERFSRDGPQQGVLIKQFRDDGTIAWELRATRARCEEGAWWFENAAISHFDDNGRLPQGAEQRFVLYQAEDLHESPRQILESLRPVEELSAAELLRTLRANPALPRPTRNVFNTMIAYRLSFPFACLVGALLGVGLSVKREKGSALRGFATAIGIMILYYVVSQITVLLGKNGSMPAVLAGTVPTLFFIGWGGWEVYRRR